MQNCNFTYCFGIEDVCGQGAEENIWT